MKSLALAVGLILPPLANASAPVHVLCSQTRRGPTFNLERRPDGTYAASIGAVDAHLQPRLAYDKDALRCTFHPGDARIFRCAHAGGLIFSTLALQRSVGPADDQARDVDAITIAFRMSDFPRPDAGTDFVFHPSRCSVVSPRVPSN